MNSRFVPKCQFCKKTDGPLIRIPAGDDYVPARRGYLARGEGPHTWHEACRTEREAFEAASRAKYQAEFDAQVAAMRARLTPEQRAEFDAQ